MNKQEADILNILADHPFQNQRVLAEQSGRSLGIINKSLKSLKDEGFLTADYALTEKSRQLLKERSPKRAVILAAGFGMRMVPINLTTPKAMLEVKGERLIERLIRQLHEVNVTDITVVAGFLKDEFEYLIDDYGIKLVINKEYAGKNNLHSMACVTDLPGNIYIVPCDIWCEENPFRCHEAASWYMMADAADPETGFRVNRKEEVVRVGSKSQGRKAENEVETPHMIADRIPVSGTPEDMLRGQRMVGITYLVEEDWDIVKHRLDEMSLNARYDNLFWEESLFEAGKDRMMIPARVVSSDGVIEINTYEQLRDLDSGSGHLSSDAIDTIAEVFGIQPGEITDISMLKKGMTNRSFLFRVKGKKYIMRIPGEGTDQLIDRQEEAAVFRAISGLGFCDDPVYINPDTGFKITAFLEGVRSCDPENESDLRLCMKKLRTFHEMNLQVEHTFDIYGQIEFYESLWNGASSIYRDYATTKARVMELREYIEKQPKQWGLTHIDAVPDNFLFHQKDGKEVLQLTDWEYSGMQDPHVDLAMFSIYSLYSKAEVDHLIDIYFEGACDEEVRTKIYCYVALCGMLWSNWCEYKRQLGVEFGEYSLRQYRYAKDFYRYAKERMKNE